jgi:Tol biopolymer transport system component
LTTGASDGLPAWSADSKSLLYSDGRSIKSLELASGHARLLIHGVDEFGASWSPNGRELAYTHGFVGSPFDGGDGTTTVYITTAKVSARRRLLGHNVNGGTPAWSPDGKNLAVVGYEGLYLVGVDGSGLHRVLKQSFDTPGTPSWSPDGKEIAFVGNGQIETVKRNGTGLRTLTHCTCGTQTDSASFSPDGRELVFSATDGLYVIRATGRKLHRITRY